MLERLLAAYDELGAIEAEARDLENQNLADIIAAARARILQASKHPDTTTLRVEAKMPGGLLAPLPFGRV